MLAGIAPFPMFPIVNTERSIMQITVQIKTIYGKETIYPVDATATLFAEISGNKTLTREVIAKIKALGYQINVQQQPVTL